MGLPSFANVPSTTGNTANVTKPGIIPSGHQRLFFFPNTNLLLDHGDYDPILIDMMNGVRSLRPRFEIVEDDTRWNAIVDHIVMDVLNQTLCNGTVGVDYIEDKLEKDMGILAIFDNRMLQRSVDSAVIAFASFYIEPRITRTKGTQRVLELNVFCSRSGYKQFGTILMNDIVDLAVASNCSFITLSSVPEAVGFYQKYGFEEVPNSYASEPGLVRMKYDVKNKAQLEQQQYANIQPFGGKKRRHHRKTRRTAGTNRKRHHNRRSLRRLRRA